MSKASNLIERAEAEAGCRVDDPDNDEALAILFGAVSRALGQHKFEPRDDFAVGKLLLHEMSPEGKAEEDSKQALASLLAMGLSPDDIHNLTK